MHYVHNMFTWLKLFSMVRTFNHVQVLYLYSKNLVLLNSLSKLLKSNFTNCYIVL